LNNTLSNLEAGESELWKKNDSLSSKWLLMKVAGVLFIFIVLFLLFIA
jgi:hypothetical protein